MNELIQSPKDTSRSCIFDFPDRPVDSLPPNIPPILPFDFPYEPIKDWPPIFPNPPVPGVDPIPGSNPHPNSGESVPPGGDVFATFQPYTSIASNAERRDLYLAIQPAGFPARFNLGWNYSGYERGLVQAIHEYSPKTVMDSILSAETGHSTSDNNTACGIMIYNKVFADGSLATYFAYYAMWWDLIQGNQLYSFAPVAMTGGIDNAPHLTFDNAAQLVISPANFNFWAHHSNLGLPAGSCPTTKTINTAKIFTDNELTPFTVDIG